MRLLLPATLSVGLAALACAPAQAAPPSPSGCLDPGHNRIFIQTDTTIFRQGATIRIGATFDRLPGGDEAIDLGCTRDWRITGPATLAPDRRSFTIGADAAPGSEIVLSYRWHDERAEARYRVVARDAVVLTGFRGQRAIEGCEGLDPVRELEFAPGNRFSVTFMPFESYKDYWGTYSYDPATGALRMTVESGNNVPPDLDLDGRAILMPDGRLVLEDMYLGTTRGPPPIVVDPATGMATVAKLTCRYTF